MSNHTPGPWMVEEVTLTISAPNPKEGRANLPVAYCPPDTRNREANAVMIAAAPDLLAALQKMVEVAQHLRSANQEDEALRSALIAISKAEDL